MEEKRRPDETTAAEPATQVDRRTVLQLGLTAGAGLAVSGWRPRSKPSVVERSNGSITAVIGSNGEIYEVTVSYRLPAKGGPFYLEVLAIDGRYFDMHALTGQKGAIVLPVDLWDMPDGTTHILTVVDGQQAPVAGIASTSVDVPAYPELREGV